LLGFFEVLGYYKALFLAKTVGVDILGRSPARERRKRDSAWNIERWNIERLTLLDAFALRKKSLAYAKRLWHTVRGG
jgi:hypothetical protein